MALQTFTYNKGAYVDSCSGCGPIEVGENVKIVLDQTVNPDWPTYFLAEVTNIELTPNGPTYTFEYDDVDFTDAGTGMPFTIPPGCNFSIDCATCCDMLDLDDLVDIPDLINQLVSDPSYCDGVVACVDSELLDTFDCGPLPTL